MPSKVIIAAILALAVVFGVLFQLSLRFQDENLPPISFCCQNSSCTFEANTVTSKEIYAESYHNTKYKIDSRKLACEDYETIPIPSVQENGFLLLSPEKDEEACSLDSYCLTKNSEGMYSATRCSDAKCGERKVDSLNQMFWNTNLIAVPFVILAFLVFTFYERVGETQKKYFAFYLVNLATLHICLAITKLIPYELKTQPLACAAFSYASYYSLVACFSWLYVMCNDVFYSINKLRNSDEDAPRNCSSIRLWMYNLCAVGLPVLITVMVYIGDQHLGSTNFQRCTRLRSDMKKPQLYYVFTPILAIVMCGIILFAQTKMRIQTIVREAEKSQSISTSEVHDEEKKFNLFFRLFLVMIVSWTLFIAEDRMKSHVVTLMNCLHVLALLSLLNKAYEQKRKSIIRRYDTFRNSLRNRSRRPQTTLSPHAHTNELLSSHNELLNEGIQIQGVTVMPDNKNSNASDPLALSETANITHKY